MRILGFRAITYSSIAALIGWLIDGIRWARSGGAQPAIGNIEIPDAAFS
jgi:hypothetical protein